MDISLKQLEIFRWVVVAGSITKASRRIGLSQPSISQQLARLEAVLDAQLVVRNRTGQVTVTPAGEYWFKASEDLLGRMAGMVSEHEKRFRHSSVVLWLGATPVLRGRFTAAAARIARSAPGFVKFELVYNLNSALLVEQLRMHQINFAIATEQSILDDQNSFAISRLFEDKIAWAVPASVSDDDIRAALNGPARVAGLHPVLSQYIEIDPQVTTRAASDDWYRHYLPYATPTFATPTFLSSIEPVAGGLGTCHVPISLPPNLGKAALAEVKLFRINGMNRMIVMAMHKHLLTHPAYAHIYSELTAYCRDEYLQSIGEDEIPDFEDLLQPAPTGRLMSAAE